MREPSRVRVTGPLEPFAAGFIAELQEAGYRPAAAAVQVRVLAHLSGWMQEQGVSPGGVARAGAGAVPAGASRSGRECARRRDGGRAGSSPWAGDRARARGADAVRRPRSCLSSTGGI